MLRSTHGLRCRWLRSIWHLLDPIKSKINGNDDQDNEGAIYDKAGDHSGMADFFPGFIIVLYYKESPDWMQ